MTVEEQNSEEMQTASEKPASELRQALWSVVSFDKSEANNLTYAEAEEKMCELLEQKVSGLCIVTDEAASRILGKT